MEIKQQLKLNQQLVMTPQLQQAIKLLQISRLELAEVVREEILENPMLEEHGDQSGSDAESTGDLDGNSQLDPDQTKALDKELGIDRDKLEASNKDNEIDWERYLENHANQLAPTTYTGGAGANDSEHPSFEASLTRTEHLGEHLE